jgi:alanine dehydrogenase
MGEERKIKFGEGIAKLFSHEPKEAMLEVANKSGSLYIGIPKETRFQENRISLTPESVAILVDSGHRIVIETKAGEGAHLFDTDYSEAGAEIAYSTEEVFKADILLKASPPSPEEIAMMHMNQTLISPIHLPTMSAEVIEQLMAKKITALAFEYIMDNSATFPIVRSMSEIAGNTSVLIAAEYLSNLKHGKGLLLGGITGIPPASVVILGAGTVGEYAARTALGLGAEVKIFDNSIYKLKRLQSNIGMRVYTSILRQDILTKVLHHADVAIGAIHSKSGRTPIVVTEDMVSTMKAGSVIIDVSIDQGGCFETSEITDHNRPFFKKYDVIHYCVPNIPARVPRTASNAISNVLTPQLLEAGQLGNFEKLLYNNANTRHGVYIYKGSLTNLHLSEHFKIKFTDLDLLFSATF